MDKGGIYKFFTDGSRDVNCQVNRIDEALKVNNQVLVNDPLSADVIYSNNPNKNWDHFISLKRDGLFKGKLIFNILDIPSWNFPHYSDFDTIFNQLKQADQITTISNYVKWQLIRYFKLQSHVIYNPIQDINNNYRQKGEKPYPQFRAMLIGRLRDPSKRVHLAVRALQMAGYKPEEVVVIGTENIGWGTYAGVVSTEQLNQLYNSVDFVCMTSIGEGLGLPGLEALVAGAIPVVCSDLTTFNEFYSPFLGNYPNEYDLAFFIGRGRDFYVQNYSAQLDDLRTDVLEKCSPFNVARELLVCAQKLYGESK